MSLSYAEVSQKSTKFLEITSLTVEEFEQLVPVFEEKFQERMQSVCLDGKPRVGRKYVTYANSPLPTPEDRLLFIMVYLKTNALQVMHGDTFGMPQNKANQWIHTLLPVLQESLHALGDAPARSLEELSERLGTEVIGDATANAVEDAAPLPETSSETAQTGLTTPDQPPLFAMMVPSGAFSGQRTLMNKKSIIVGRRNAIR